VVIITPAANTVLPKAGLNGFDWTFVLNFPAFAKPENVGGNLKTKRIRKTFSIPNRGGFVS